MVKDLFPPMRPRKAKAVTEGPGRSCYCGGIQLLPVIQCRNRKKMEKEFPHPLLPDQLVLSVGETYLEGCRQSEQRTCNLGVSLLGMRAE